MKTNEVMEVALRAGEALLRNGAEIYRVEDTVQRICKSYNVEAEIFALPTGIFMTVIGKDGEPVSYIRRIKSRTVDLRKIERVNSFSRSLQNNPISYNQAISILQEIEEAKGFNFALRLCIAGVNAFVYTVLFKGSLQEAAAAFFIGMLIYFSKEKISRAGVFNFFEDFASGMVAGAASLAVVRLFPIINLYKVIIASIIILLPGVAITNAIKDALNGDIVSSQFRLAEAIFSLAAVAAGVAVVLSAGLTWAL